MDATPYSLKQHAEHALSTNFKVKEFRCKDGSDAVFIDDLLVKALQALRDHYGKPITISSAYRTPEYNAKVGGAKDSQHKYGTAADIRIDGVAPRELAAAAEKVLAEIGIAGGVGLYEYGGKDASRSFVHIDVRDKRARWLQTTPTGGAVNVSGFGAAATTGATKLWEGCRGDAVKDLQTRLGIPSDGVFGPKTKAAVIAYQIQHGLTPDGVVGPKTWAALGVGA